jgi:HlyD family secretion protein
MPAVTPINPAASLRGNNGSNPDTVAPTIVVKEVSNSPPTPDVKPDSNAVSKGAPASAPPGDQKRTDKSAQQSKAKKRTVVTWLVVAAVGAAVAIAAWISLEPAGPGPGFVSGNGRIEATEIDIASKLAGRIDQIMVDEGDFVQEGQVVAQMNTDVLKAQSDEARAQSEESINAVNSDKAQVVAREADVAAARATVTDKNDLVDAAQRRLNRFELLAKAGAVSQQDLDDDRASLNETVAEVATAQAQVDAALASVKAAQAQVIGAKSIGQEKNSTGGSVADGRK